MSGYRWKVLKSKSDYEQAMERFLMLATCDLAPDTEDYDEFELLNLLIGHYEKANYPIRKPTPLDAIKFRMDQMGLTQADMTAYLGSKSKVSEVLSGKKKLSLTMIKRLHDGLGISLDVLIQDSSSVDEWCTIEPDTFSPEHLEITETLKHGKHERYLLFFSGRESCNNLSSVTSEHIVKAFIYKGKHLENSFNRKEISSASDHSQSEVICTNQIDDNEYSQTNYENIINSQSSIQCFH